MAGPLERRPAVNYELDRTQPSVGQVIRGSAPGLQVLRNYPRRWLRTDVFAGLAVAAYLVPQVMAYAAIVDLPPVVGLWTALAACLAYAVLGGSRVLSVGPESTTALLAAASVAPLAGGDPVRVMALTAALSLMVALWCLIGRLVRLGVVADLLSQPLQVGYLAGGAVLMVVGQLGRLTGTEVDGDTTAAQVRSFVRVLADTHLATLAVSALTLAVLLGIARWRRRWPAPLIAVAAATVAAAALDLPSLGVAAVGPVPTGMPGLRLPDVSVGDLMSLAVAALGVAVVAYSDNTLTGRAFKPRVETGEGATPTPVVEAAEVDPQQELVALGGVNLAAGLVGGFPVSSSGSRTALAISAGARSQMYSLVAAGCVVAVLAVAGPLISHLPQAALGAVVLYAAGKLVSVADLVRLARFRYNELGLAVVACLGTVLLGILAGVGVAIALSLLEMTRRLARPHEAVLGRVDGLAGMHDVDDYPDATTLPGLIVYRYDAPLFFANVGDLRRRALKAVELENAADPDHPVRWFVLNVEANVEIDITAADGLRALHGELAARGVQLGLARVKHDLQEPLARAGLVELIGPDMLFPTLPVAEQAYLDWVAREVG